MTFDIELSSVSLDLPVSLVSCSEITLICFDVLGCFGMVVKSFHYFQSLHHNHRLVSSSLVYFLFLIMERGSCGPSNKTEATMFNCSLYFHPLDVSES